MKQLIFSFSLVFYLGPSLFNNQAPNTRAGLQSAMVAWAERSKGRPMDQNMVQGSPRIHLARLPQLAAQTWLDQVDAPRLANQTEHQALIPVMQPSEVSDQVQRVEGQMQRGMLEKQRPE